MDMTMEQKITGYIGHQRTNNLMKILYIVCAAPIFQNEICSKSLIFKVYFVRYNKKLLFLNESTKL